MWQKYGLLIILTPAGLGASVKRHTAQDLGSQTELCMRGCREVWVDFKGRVIMYVILFLVMGLACGTTASEHYFTSMTDWL